MASESFGVFWGGLFYNSCVPLHSTLNYCGQCVYCFADLSDPDRRNSPKPAVKILREFRDRNRDGTHKRKSYAAHLLRQGYPFICSNLVDPLSKSNHKAFAAIQSAAELQGVPYSIQTKIGADPKPAYDALKRARKPIVWYISVTTLLDEERKKTEPGASSIPDRLRFIADAVSAGHCVMVGINPVIPHQIPDADALVGELKSRGVKGIWVQGLHLSRKKQTNLTRYGRTALGSEVLDAAIAPREWTECLDKVREVREAANREGIPNYDNQQGTPTDYFDAYRAIYPKTFPLMQDWVNFCWEHYPPGQLLYFQDFLKFFSGKFPKGEWGLREHFCAIAHRNTLLGLYIPQRMDYSALLLETWRHLDTIVCPVNVDCFGWVAEWEKQDNGELGWTQYLDDNGLPILKFCPEGTNGEGLVQL